MKQLLIICICLFTVITLRAEQVRLSCGTVISVKIMQDTDSKSGVVPMTIVAGDVYDDMGKRVVIKKNTPVDIQFNYRQENLTGDVGLIEITPISTTSVDGRLITFVTESIIFKGNESIRRSRMQARISAGTSFIATIANDYVFNVE